MSLFRKLVGVFQAAGLSIRKRLLGGLPPVYIEDVFSTWLYAGNSSTQSIVNGIDLSTKGGMVWTKSRNAAYDNTVYDTARGTGNNKALYTDTTDVQGAFTSFQDLTAYNTNGYSIGSPILLNETGKNYVSWTFREQTKFFDVVTYTGTGSTRTVAHNLGSVPGCIIIKNLSDTDGWLVYHRGIGATKTLGLNATGAADNEGATYFNDTEPTSTVFTVKEGGKANQSGNNYVAYLFAHDAGGFGLTGTDNVISCGSFSVLDQGPEATVTLGYEPQWIMVKRTNGTGNWLIFDTMRGWEVSTASTDPDDEALWANLSDAANPESGGGFPTATGFVYPPAGAGNATYIYIAVRKGPMKVPTVATTVFNALTRNGTGAAASVTTVGFSPDMAMLNIRDSGGRGFVDKLRGPKQSLIPSDTGAELTSPSTKDVSSFNQNGISFAGASDQFSSNSNGLQYVNFYLRRAPGFFDVVCATPSYPTPITHNLGAVPKLRIEKTRNYVAEWKVLYYDGTTDEYELALNSTRAAQLQSGRPALPTSTSFVAYYDTVPIVVYLFAPVTGVQYISKFTGNGSSQTINCGFTGGARFICIKAFSTTGDWKVIDTARGIVSGNDPTLAFNTTSAEVTGTDCIDPDSSGFIVNQESTNNLNVNGVEYLVWAIA